MWQVSGRSDTTFDEYKRLDLYYVDNWSLAHDAADRLQDVLGRASPARRPLTPRPHSGRRIGAMMSRVPTDGRVEAELACAWPGSAAQCGADTVYLAARPGIRGG